MYSRLQYRGLTAEEVVEAKRKGGDNRLPERKMTSFGKRLIENLSDPIIRILLIALAVNILLTFRHINWAESIGIVLSILISAFVSSISEYGSEKAFDSLEKSCREQQVCVIRDGEKKTISSDDLVKGDIIMLFSGEKIPCDGILLEGKLSVDESPLNGESREAMKAPDGDFELIPGDNAALLRGSLIYTGEGICRAERVGENTTYGKIAMEIRSEKRESPLKVRLQKLAGVLSKIGYFAAIVVAATYLWSHFVIESGYSLPLILQKLGNVRETASALIHAVTIAVTVIVVAVPEGLPMMITVVLSANMKKMLRDGVLVRKLVGIETAGSMDLLFTDKTGTITTGKLKVEAYLDAEGQAIPINPEIAACVRAGSPCTIEDKKIIGGNATERALFSSCKSQMALPAEEYLPFDSARKYTAARIGNKTYYKGAPELLLPYCRSYYDKGGTHPISENGLLAERISFYSSCRSRIILLAVSHKEIRPDILPDDLCLLAVAVLRDGIRTSAVGAVRSLREAGIRVVMITGDSADTARAIARDAGLLKDQQLILTGAELSKMSDYELRAALPRLAVVARALPQDKSRLVRLAQESGSVVGMTGDGVNDAPALKLADVGFSMGNGSDIAKEASDIVLLKEDLCSISNAVLYGRTIFRSIRKFILFQLTMNLSAVGVSFFGQLLGIESPVTVVQMLWVNLIMDTLGGLAFAGEPALRHYLKASPARREEPILSGSMLRRIACMGIFTTVICVAFLGSEGLRGFYGYYCDPLPFFTAYFALFIFSGIAVSFTSRSENARILANIGKNKPFLFIMCGIVLTQLLILYFGGEIFRCTPLSVKELAIPVLISLTVLPADLLRRILSALIVKNREKSHIRLAKRQKMDYNNVK